MPSVCGGMWLAGFFSTHTLDDLLSQFGFAAMWAFATAESWGVPFPGKTVVITATLLASFTHHLVGA